MKFNIKRASGQSIDRKDVILLTKDPWDTYGYEIEINTLEELLKLSEELGKELIISDDKTILIYDDYLE